ncbi:MAG: hypothetical protein IRZ08_18420, partial [Frankia sp.]|nr:hypothetical protein [Frankia sp.]
VDDRPPAGPAHPGHRDHLDEHLDHLDGQGHPVGYAHWFDVTAFCSDRLVVLPDDPLLSAVPAGQPAPAGVEVVPDQDALLRRLADALVGHLEPVVRAMRGTARLGPPALWGMVATQCAETFLLTEVATGDPQAGRAAADRFFALVGHVVRQRPRWVEFRFHGRTCTGIRGGACCLAHRLSGAYCATCPFMPDDDRRQRLRAEAEYACGGRPDPGELAAS